jgi:hypothetical protein
VPKGKTKRHGKLVTGGHSSKIGGLRKFLQKLETWDEIDTIRVGPLTVQNKRGGAQQRTKVRDPSAKRQAKASGGLAFRATRLSVIGQLVTGIKCVASHGNSTQDIFLTSANLPALTARLKREGYARNL